MLLTVLVPTGGQRESVGVSLGVEMTGGQRGTCTFEGGVILVGVFVRLSGVARFL